MKIGLALPHYDFSFPDGRRAHIADVVAYAERAEALGFDEVWVSDHLFFDLEKYGGPKQRFRTPESLTMLAAIAAKTSRVRLGSLVLNAALRNPMVLLEQARSLQDLSCGRLDLGLGAGWYEPEFEAAGLPFGSATARIERLRILLGMLKENLPDVPLVVGGKGGPRLMDVIAEQADGWNVAWFMDRTTYEERLDALGKACAKYGRDPALVGRSIGFYTLIGSDDADVERRFERALAWAQGAMRLPLDHYREHGLFGTAEHCARRIKEFEALGVEQIIVSLAVLPFSITDDEQLEMAAELLSLVR